MSSVRTERKNRKNRKNRGVSNCEGHLNDALNVQIVNAGVGRGNPAVPAGNYSQDSFLRECSQDA